MYSKYFFRSIEIPLGYFTARLTSDSAIKGVIVVILQLVFAIHWPVAGRRYLVVKELVEVHRHDYCSSFFGYFLLFLRIRSSRLSFFLFFGFDLFIIIIVAAGFIDLGLDGRPSFTCDTYFLAFRNCSFFSIQRRAALFSSACGIT